MKKIQWILIIGPLVLGFVMGIIFNYTGIQNPTIYLRADLGTITFILGVILSIFLLMIFSTINIINNIQTSASKDYQEEKRQFIQRLDHEIKNPLTAIIAGLANLKEDHKNNKTISSIESQVSRLTRLMTELRKLSDLEQRPLETTSLNLNTFLPEIFEIAKNHKSAEGKNFNLQIPQAPWPLPDIVGDRDLLFLSIHNLLDNAIKYSKQNDTIELRASEEDKYILIEIADTGPGIPDNEIKQIWAELFRGTDARSIEGSGLGLALVDSIIKRHQGTISARSRKGHGTVFEVRLPKNHVTEL